MLILSCKDGLARYIMKGAAFDRVLVHNTLNSRIRWFTGRESIVLMNCIGFRVCVDI